MASPENRCLGKRSPRFSRRRPATSRAPPTRSGPCASWGGSPISSQPGPPVPGLATCRAACASAMLYIQQRSTLAAPSSHRLPWRAGPAPTRADQALRSSGDDVFAKAGTALVRQISGETILVPVREGVADVSAIFVLNEAAQWIWQHLDGRTGANALASGMAEEFGISGNQARRDLATFVRVLRTEGLVISVGAPDLWQPVGDATGATGRGARP